MHLKRLFLMALLSVATFSVSAQEAPAFPVEGLYAIQYQDYNQNKIFNRVLIDPHSITLKLNEVEVRFYKLKGMNETGYQVEQYFPEREVQPSEKETFTVRIDYHSETEIVAVLIYPTASTTLELLKVD